MEWWWRLNGGADGSRREIWALQSGVTPGSDYTLLSRKPGAEGHFDILQQRCPSRLVRKGPVLDVLSTDYCLVKTRGDVRELARLNAKLPPVATMAHVERPGP